jgi:hypothetical protein
MCRIGQTPPDVSVVPKFLEQFFGWLRLHVCQHTFGGRYFQKSHEVEPKSLRRAASNPVLHARNEKQEVALLKPFQ